MLELVFTAYEQSDSDCRRTDRWISFMIGELDQLNRGLDFKSVNDTLGHQLNVAEFTSRISERSLTVSSFERRARRVRYCSILLKKSEC